ncbi:ABC transporter substrate-binding protein [Ornithinimicrobium sp. Y1694]|uniref:ABC transporter substrate-binding protein n=1 Tax=Ornithinimicrobium sp. Y1694 TaxID=3418590 RepID=UPI003CEABF59
MQTRPTFRLVTALAAGAALTLTACGNRDNGDNGTTGSDETPATAPAAGTEDSTDDAADAAAQTDDAEDTADDAAGTAAAGESDGEFPVTVDADNGEVTIEERPERIISLSPSTTESLFAIGAGDQVLAVDSFSTYPEEAPTTDLSGWDPNIEAIVGYEPDLVIIANDMNDIVASLEAVDIPILVSGAPADVDSGYDSLAGLGLATGHVDETAGVIAGMRAAMDDAYAEAEDAEGIRIYHELDDTFYAASSNSFIGSVYEQMGAVNIADEADTESTGYPQLTEEAIIEANPQLIVITDQVTYTAEDVANRPGWDQIDAVINDNIVVVDADIASRWGPRLPQLVELVAQALNQVNVPVGR